MLPIHAYPVLNRENLREAFPKLIDFGLVDISTPEYMVFISKIYNKYIRSFLWSQKFL